jgi:hypothetical protein
MAERRSRRGGRFLSDYGLGVALGGIFLLTMLMHTWSGWMVYANEQLQHGSKAVLWGNDGYIWMWLENTFQNRQSEFLQMLATVVLTTFLIHRHSQQSADEMDGMSAKIDHIMAMLEDGAGTARAAK